MRTLLKTRVLLGSILIAVMVIGSFGCSDDDEPKTKPPEGLVDELRMALDTEPTTLDPNLAYLSEDWSIIKQLNRGLFWYDEDLKLVPMVARELPTTKNGGVSNDGLVYRIKVRNDARWSDGRAITAQDFEYSIKRLLNPLTESETAASFYDITGAEALNSCVECEDAELARLESLVGVRAEDEATIAFTLRTRRSSFPFLLSTAAALPVREDIVEKYGEAWTEAGNIVSSGPFVLDEWLPGSQIVLKRNPEWWGTRPALQTVTIHILPSPNDLYSMYQAGELDAIVVSPSLQTLVNEFPEHAKQNRQLPVLASLAYIFNLETPPFDNADVRKAISMAVDREAFGGETMAAVSPGLSWLPPGMPGHNSKRGDQYKFDPEKGRSLLEKAGFEGGKNLAPITYSYPAENPRAEAAATFLVEQVREHLGIQIALNPIPRADWLTKLRQGTLSILITGHASEYLDPEGFLRELWTCERYDGRQCGLFAGGNFSHYANPEFDALMLRAAKEPDAERRIESYADAEDVLVNDAPAVFLGYETRSVLVKPYVRNGKHTPLDWLPFEYFLDKVTIGE